MTLLLFPSLIQLSESQFFFSLTRIQFFSFLSPAHFSLFLTLTYKQGAVLRGVSARDKLPLVIRFRPNKEQKERDRLLTGSGNNNNINWSTSGGSQANNHFVSSDDTAIRKVSSSTEAAGSGGGGYNNHSTTGSPDSHPKKPTPVPPMGECYFWRTTGCRNGPQCRFAHYPSSKGIDFAPFMKRTTSSSSCHPVTNKSYRK